MNDALLRIENLDVKYGGVQALHAVNLNVARGEIVALLGANGAGKTSLLRAISGLVRPARGRVAFDGREMQRLPAYAIARAGVAHVPEGRRIFSRMSVRENLEIGCNDMRYLRERMERQLTFFPRLRERFTQSAGLLSGGEQQMLAIGRALMGEPRMLLLDEPSLGLAPLVIGAIYKLLREIHATGTTMLIVEQNARAALALASRAYVLESGRILREGAAQQLATDPSVVQAYLGGG